MKHSTLRNGAFSSWFDINLTEAYLDLDELGKDLTTNVSPDTTSKSSPKPRTAIHDTFGQAIRNVTSACQPHPLPESLPTPIPLLELIEGASSSPVFPSYSRRTEAMFRGSKANDVVLETRHQNAGYMFEDIDDILHMPSTSGTSGWGNALPLKPVLEVPPTLPPGQWSNANPKIPPKAPKQNGSPSIDLSVPGQHMRRTPPQGLKDSQVNHLIVQEHHPNSSNTTKMQSPKGIKKRLVPRATSNAGQKRIRSGHSDPDQRTLVDEAIQEVLSAGRIARMPSFPSAGSESQPEIQSRVQPSDGTIDLVDEAIREARSRMRSVEASHAGGMEWLQTPAGYAPMVPVYGMHGMPRMRACNQMSAMPQMYVMYSHCWPHF